MANDYKVLGNYKKCEDTLLKAIEINIAMHGERNSLELVKNLLALIDLRKSSPDFDKNIYEALEKAADDISEDDLYKLGYFRIKILNNPVNDNEK